MNNNACLPNTRHRQAQPYPQLQQQPILQPNTRAMERERQVELSALAHDLIARLIEREPQICEGLVMTMGPMPYRRLDCDRRALAYVRARPRKGMVRIDISGLWLIPRESRLSVPGSGACATLVVRNATDTEEAITFLLETIAATRAQASKVQEREEQRRRRLAELRALYRRSRRKRPERSDGAMLAADKPGPTNGSGTPPASVPAALTTPEAPPIPNAPVIAPKEI